MVKIFSKALIHNILTVKYCGCKHCNNNILVHDIKIAILIHYQMNNDEQKSKTFQTKHNVHQKIKDFTKQHMLLYFI